MKAVDYSKAKVVGTSKRPIKDITPDILSTMGETFQNYGIILDEEVEFLDNSVKELCDLGLIKAQPIRPVSKENPMEDVTSNHQVLVSVLRDGKPGWLSLGSLSRRDKDNNIHSPFCNEMVGLSDFAERLEHLRGKKIKCVEQIDCQFPMFLNGMVDRTQSVPGHLPVIEYVK